MENERVDFSNFPVNDSPTPVNWRGRVFHVRPILEMEEASRFVYEAISACYDEENETMVPEIVDYVFRRMVISYYSDIDLPEDEHAKYKMVYLTDIYDTMVKHASRAQIDSLRKTVETTVFGYK